MMVFLFYWRRRDRDKFEMEREFRRQEQERFEYLQHSKARDSERDDRYSPRLLEELLSRVAHLDAKIDDRLARLSTQPDHVLAKTVIDPFGCQTRSQRS